MHPAHVIFKFVQASRHNLHLLLLLADAAASNVLVHVVSGWDGPSVVDVAIKLQGRVAEIAGRSLKVTVATIEG